MSTDAVSNLLIAKEAELAASLASARAKFGHMGDRGDAAEAAVRELLSQHLPRWFDVGDGEVIDSAGRRSRQQDVVITTVDQPFRQGPNEPGLFIVESVFAAGEVKSNLTTAELSDVIKKGQSVKSLTKTHLVGDEVFANPADTERWVSGPPPVFAFSFECDISPKTLVNRLASDAQNFVDAVFVLGRGAAINYGQGDGMQRLQLVDGSDVRGWAWSVGQPSLLHFLDWLHALPRVQHRQSPFLNYLKQTPGQGSLEILLPDVVG
jgi:hypothetical protein